MRRALLLLSLALVTCKIEPVLDIEPVEVPDPPASWFFERPDVERVDEETSLVEAELRQEMPLLTSAVLEGRRPGSEGAGLTASHIEHAMKDIGLFPDGIGGGWRQPVVVRIRTTDDGRLELPVVGEATESEEDTGPEVLVHGKDIVLWRSDVAGAWTDELPVVDVGFGIVAPELGVDDYRGKRVDGAVVLVRAGVPEDPAFDAEATERHGSYESKLAQARAAGAAGCLVATDALEVESGWQELVAEYSQPHVDAAGTHDPLEHALTFAGLLSVEANAAIRAWLVAAQLEPSRSGSGAKPLPPRLRATVTTTERTIVDPNVVGRIPGAVRPQEVIVVLAHWDAGGTGPILLEGGAAIDNATGVAALLATARKSTDWVRRGRTPDRSIAFVATASDSLDLAGTRALLATGPLQRSVIVAIVSLDVLSVHAGGPSVGMVGGDASTLGDRVRMLRPSIRDIAPVTDPITPSHIPALAAGIPAITITRYDPADPIPDTYDPDGGVTDLRDDVGLVFDLVWTYAESTDRPTLRE